MRTPKGIICANLRLPLRLHFHRPRNGRWNLFYLTNGAQSDKRDVVLKLIGDIERALDRQSRFANVAGTG